MYLDILPEGPNMYLDILPEKSSKRGVWSADPRQRRKEADKGALYYSPISAGASCGKIMIYIVREVRGIGVCANNKNTWN